MVRANAAPTVSVLMTVCDPPQTMLQEAVGSVLAQTFRDFEFLIFNDGGRDENVRGQLDALASGDARIRLFHEPHRGVPATSNLGLGAARGLYVARHDADDWSDPERLSLQVAFLRKRPELALTGAGTHAHRADGKPLWRLRLPHKTEDLKRALWSGNPFVHGSTMFRREKALAIGGYREQFPWSSDYDFLWRLSERGGAENVQQVLYHYRYTSGSISARRAADQSRVYRAAQLLAGARKAGEVEDVGGALAAADAEPQCDSFQASLKQADHVMLAGDFTGARRAYLRLLQSRPASALAWGKILRLAIFAAIPPAREVCFR